MNNNNSPQQSNENNPIDAHTQNEPLRIADRYLLQDIIGEGSYSIVFRGYDTQKHRKVAIKELKSSGLTKEEADEAQQLFFNEINILKSLEHPGIPKVYDFFIFEDRHYMVMQWVKGESLLSVLERGETLSQGEAVHYMKQISDALVYLQKEERQVIYKDLKPSNILVNENGNARIIDFGTARFYSPEKKKDTHVLGTPGYAPPEAYTGTQTDFSADVYSLGATFYHLTTGEEPFQFKFKIPPAGKFKPELTEEFSSLLADCLKPRDKRIKNAGDLKREIDKLGFDESDTKDINNIFIKYAFYFKIGIISLILLIAMCTFKIDSLNASDLFLSVFLIGLLVSCIVILWREKYDNFLSLIIFIVVYLTISLCIFSSIGIISFKRHIFLHFIFFAVFVCYPVALIFKLFKHLLSKINFKPDKFILLALSAFFYFGFLLCVTDYWPENISRIVDLFLLLIVEYLIPPYLLYRLVDYVLKRNNIELNKMIVSILTLILYILILRYSEMLNFCTPFYR